MEALLYGLPFEEAFLLRKGVEHLGRGNIGRGVADLRRSGDSDGHSILWILENYQNVE